MSIEGLFARLVPEFARQATSTEENARRHAEADEALAKAEYEFFDLQRDLQAALDVPLRDRAIKVAAAPAADEAKVAARPSLAARIAAAVA
jgi:hypothetical protein